jgi:transcriptional regulator with GAF, ATPase, and Fis domain
MAYLRIVDTMQRTTEEVLLRKPINSIGRRDGNDVVLADPTVAATHANIIKSGHGCSVSVLDRSHELYVNGKRVRKADLGWGDRILLGRYELTLMEGEPARDPAADQPDTIDALKQLVDFSQQLMTDTSPQALFRKLLRAVVILTGAEKGFVILMQDGQRNLAASHNVDEDASAVARISDSIVERVVQSRKPLIVSDAMRDVQFARAKSVVDLRLSSVMCVPMLYRDDLLGCLYLGNDNVTDLFTRRDLDLLHVFASQASLLVHTALMLNELKTTNRNLRQQLRKSAQGEMIGSSDPIQAVFKVLRRVAPTDISVLVLGETGTGKELVALELHRLSPRTRKPFVSINCGAIPENLLESELFGHKKGAFTGAVTDKMGKFEAAEGGTLFLDEISEMPMNLQVKLLRVLQERKIERVGELKPRPIDIRVIAATNRDIEAEIRAGRFREDLFYRLNEVTVGLPPLRDRGDDILLLARFFLNKYAEQYGSRARGFTNDCIKAMKGYYWPGNVRQLESRVKRAVIMSDRALLNGADLGLSAGDRRNIKPLAEAEEEFKMGYVREVLEVNNWNKAQTARDLGVDPRTIFRYIEKFDDGQ